MLLDYSSRRRQRRNIFIVLREEIYYITLLKKIILNFYNFGRNKHDIIIKKAKDSWFSQVLFSIFEIIFSMTNDYVDMLYLYYKIVIFIIGRKVCPVGVMYTHYARRK